MKSINCFGPGGISGSGSIKKWVDEFALYSQRKKRVKIAKNMAKYFTILQEISKAGFNRTLRKFNFEQLTSLTDNFYKNFSRLQKKQQNHYLLQLIIEIERRISENQQIACDKTHTVDTNQIEEAERDSGRCLQTKCSYSSEGQKKLGFIKSWREVILKLNKPKKRLTIKYKNRVFHIALRSYVLFSNKQQQLIILESTHAYEQDNLRTILLQFNKITAGQFQEFYRNILDVIVAYQIDRLMMQNLFNDKFQKLDDPKINRIRLYLSQSAITRCTSQIQALEEQSRKRKSLNRTVLNESYQNNESLVIDQYRNDGGTWYEALATIHDRHQPITINFLQVYQNSHKYLAKLTILETHVESDKPKQQNNFQQESIKFCAFYHKLKIAENTYGQQVFLKKVKKREENQQVLYFINSDHAFNQSFIQYLKVTLTPATLQHKQHFLIKLLVRFNQSFLDNKPIQQHLIQYIREFYFMFERLRSFSSLQNSQIDVKELNSKFYIEKDLISRFQEQQVSPMEFLKKNNSLTSRNFFIKRQSVSGLPLNAYLNRKHKVEPTNQKIGKIMKQHYLYKQWQRLPKGGLKCTNYQLVAFQKSLYKTVIRKFGENLLKGRNIINFSLPVVCFKKQSHLQSLAQSMCFCPIYLQKAAKIKDPLQRMKFSVIIMIAVGILTVQSQKPFNPILGQTYQGYVDGCPVYLEQISHHPPISAYYMVGRGYKMYGCVQPRISLHFNGATGYSNLPHYIEFDDGIIIQVIFAKITITGMMFGDRQFYFQDKIYAYDKTNNLFTELIFGPFKSGGIFSSSSQPQDYFHGKIYEVTQEFKGSFDKSNPKGYPSQNDIIRQRLMFDGIWSGSVHMDGEEIINFKTDLPYQFVEQQYPIMSDSRYRKDLQKLVQGDKQQAQKLKEDLQQEQRRDKKLRNQQEKA